LKYLRIQRIFFAAVSNKKNALFAVNRRFLRKDKAQDMRLAAIFAGAALGQFYDNYQDFYAA
jgi:hypothetical protein